jgi:hypothetical protein
MKGGIELQLGLAIRSGIQAISLQLPTRIDQLMEWQAESIGLKYGAS